MHYTVLAGATLWLLQLVSAVVDNPLVDLIPLPREVWDSNHRMAKRAEDYNANLALQKKEQLMWTSSEKTTEKQTVVSMVVYTKQDENIIDMDKFGFLLESVSCSDKVIIKFRSKIAYLAAKLSWTWVNFNNIRSFVLVSSWDGCGEKRNREPWVVSNAAFDDKNSKVTLNAIKSTWKKVANTTVIDFGDFVPENIGGGHDKRAFDISLNKAFTLDLTTNFPENIARWNFSTPRVKANLEINCPDCGTTGELVFAGHIEASLFGGLDKFEISAKPRGVAANLNLEVALEGEVNFKGVAPYTREFELLKLPLPSGWRIPGILTFGPNIQINAGFQVDYIGGSASVTAGISAVIPDSSIAKVDLAAEKPLEISGWLPEIQTQPVKIQAQIDAEVHVYTEIAVAVTLEVLDDNGINVDIAIRVPDVEIVAAAGYTNQDGVGFCPNSVNPWGVTVDATLGASIYLEGYTEIDGDKKVFLNVPLYESPALYEFPQLCLGFEAMSPDACIDIPDENDPDYPRPSPEGQGPVFKRSELVPKYPYSPANRRSDLVLRSVEERSPSSRDPYFITCDKTKPIVVQNYPGPTKVKGLPNEVPTMFPLMYCTDRSCPTKNWDTLQVLHEDALVGPIWNTEHIYEGNWLAKFLEKMVADQFGGDCSAAMVFYTATGRAIKTPSAVVSNDGLAHETADTYFAALMQNLGTDFTYNKTMALLPGKQNRMKYRMFAGNQLDAQFKLATRFPNGETNTAEVLACQLGRIISTCKYMNYELIKAKMALTIQAIESVLTTMDTTGSKTFKAAHKTWFVDFYNNGFKKAREYLKEYATYLREKNGGGFYDDLSDDQKGQIDDMAGLDVDGAQFCPNEFEYPT